MKAKLQLRKQIAQAIKEKGNAATDAERAWLAEAKFHKLLELTGDGRLRQWPDSE